MTEIERLKRRARKLHRQTMAELDSVDCGISMLCFIRPHVGKLVREFDGIIARLKLIDPEFPR